MHIYLTNSIFWMFTVFFLCVIRNLHITTTKAVKYIWIAHMDVWCVCFVTEITVQWREKKNKKKLMNEKKTHKLYYNFYDCRMVCGIFSKTVQLNCTNSKMIDSIDRWSIKKKKGQISILISSHSLTYTYKHLDHLNKLTHGLRPPFESYMSKIHI